MNYIIPYPYSCTIIVLLISAIVGLCISRKKVLWVRYLKGLLFTFITGVGQIVLLQNIGNVPAWYYPDGSALGRDWVTFILPNTCFEDILFVPVCYSIFYLFMYLIRDIKDFARQWLPHIGVYFVVGIALFGYIGGDMAKDMINFLVIPPLVMYLLIDRWMPNQFKEQNITHAILSLAFVIVFTAPWEFFNAWRQHWVYDTLCDLFGHRGWFMNDRLHVGIFFMYAWTGFIMCYFSWVFFTPRVKANEN
jgi:hypothetical protein